MPTRKRATKRKFNDIDENTVKLGNKGSKKLIENNARVEGKLINSTNDDNERSTQQIKRRKISKANDTTKAIQKSSNSFIDPTLLEKTRKNEEQLKKKSSEHVLQLQKKRREVVLAGKVACHIISTFLLKRRHSLPFSTLSSLLQLSLTPPPTTVAIKKSLETLCSICPEELCHVKTVKNKRFLYLNVPLPQSAKPNMPTTVNTNSSNTSTNTKTEAKPNPLSTKKANSNNSTSNRKNIKTKDTPANNNNSRNVFKELQLCIKNEIVVIDKALAASTTTSATADDEQ